VRNKMHCAYPVLFDPGRGPGESWSVVIAQEMPRNQAAIASTSECDPKI